MRGLGLLNGIEINFAASDLVDELIKNFIISVPAGDKVVRFVPPLIVEQDNIDLLIEVLDKILSGRK